MSRNGEKIPRWIEAPNVFLCGFMGSGKSTVGPLIADKLGWDFVDTDLRIEAQSGRTISEIFREGEEKFRDLETEIIRQIAKGKRQVVALGGGAVIRELNRERIVSSGILVYLRATSNTLAQRVRKQTGKRPLLSAGPDLELGSKIESILASRAPFYEKASLVVDVDGKTPLEVAKRLDHLLKELKP